MPGEVRFSPGRQVSAKQYQTADHLIGIRRIVMASNISHYGKQLDSGNTPRVRSSTTDAAVRSRIILMVVARSEIHKNIAPVLNAGFIRGAQES